MTKKILLLNASWEPLQVITPKRAYSLISRERVSQGSATCIPLSAATTTISIPTVLVLNRYVNVPRFGAKWGKRRVKVRDGYACIFCGITVGDKQGGTELTKKDFTVDHIVPKSRGGKDTWTNTACACLRCNHRKADKEPHEAGMRMLWEPKTPRVDYLVMRGEIPIEWKMYFQVD